MSNFPANTPTFVNPRLADKIVQNIRLDMRANLTFLEQDFPIATIGVADETEKGLYPQVDSNVGDNVHHDIRPDGSVKSYLFFEVNGIDPDFEEDESTYSLSMVTWGQLDKIDNTKAYDFTSELIEEQLARLRTFQAEDVELFTNPEDVFDKYPGLSQEKNQYLLRPFTAWKINFDVIDLGCI